MRRVAVSLLVLFGMLEPVAAQQIAKRLIDEYNTKYTANRYELIGTSKDGEKLIVFVRAIPVGSGPLVFFKRTVCYPLEEGGWFCDGLMDLSPGGTVLK